MPNSATLVQALGTAFCAILCALSGMGGGGMMCGARVGAWAKSGYTAKDYVQDGLVAMWDGIENAGWGVHDPNATVWKDLVGSYDMFISGGIYFESDFVVNSLGGFTYNDSIPVESIVTYESVIGIEDGGTENYFFCAKPETSPGLARFYVAFIQSRNNLLSGWPLGDDNGVGITRFNVSERFSTSFTHGSYQAFVNGVAKQMVENGWSPWVRDHKFTAFKNMMTSAQGIVKNSNIRLYNRALTSAEIAANYAIDKARFNLP